MSENKAQEIQILRRGETSKLCGIGNTLLYEKTRPDSEYYDPTFPLPVALGGRSVGWYRHEIEAWLLSRPRVTSQERAAKTAHTTAGRQRKRAEQAM